MATCSCEDLLVEVTDTDLNYLKQKGSVLEKYKDISANRELTKHAGLRKREAKESPGTAVAIGRGPSR